MSAPVLFEYGDHAVRTVVLDGEPWFVAVDVCKILQHSNVSVAIQMLDEDEKRLVDGRKLDIPNLNRVNPDIWLVSEPGVYELAFRSTAAGAKGFKRWITHDVLPAIRRNGQYGVKAELSRLELIDMARESELARLALTERLTALEPAAEAWQSLSAEGSDFSAREAAQVLSRHPNVSIGQNQLLAYLRQINWVDRRNSPYQSQVDSGRLVRRITDYTDEFDQRYVRVQARITPKGVEALLKRLGGDPDLRSVPGGT